MTLPGNRGDPRDPRTVPQLIQGMKKRSMLAIATLATGFVVAAVTPSHSADKGPLGDLNVSGTLDHVDHIVSQDSFAVDDQAQGRE